MANSDAVTASREEILIGDIAYKRANSEAVMSRFGATNNFIGKFQTDIKEFKLNGSYGVATGIIGYDGIASFFYNSEIVGIAFVNGQSGSAGTTQFDIIWQDASGATQGSIFSTKPSIDSTSSNGARGFSNLTTGTTVSPTGVTLPVFSKTEFLEGEALYMVLDSAMDEAKNCSITVFYRPIN